MIDVFVSMCGVLAGRHESSKPVQAQAGQEVFISEITQPNPQTKTGIAGDIHQKILEEVAQVQKSGWTPYKTPAIDSLIAAAKGAINRGMPSHFDHEGRVYWISVMAVMPVLDVFESPVARFPLTGEVMNGVKVFGYMPSP